jgi:hypothetical protein
LTRYGIDPSLLSQKAQRKVLPVMAKTPGPPQAPKTAVASTRVVVPQTAKEKPEFHYLVEMSGSALVFHFRTFADNAAAAKRTMLDIPHLTRWSALIGAALGKVLDDEKAMDLKIAAAPV